jgi:hypothetical protein
VLLRQRLQLLRGGSALLHTLRHTRLQTRPSLFLTQSLDTAASRLRNKTGLFWPLPQVANVLSQTELSLATKHVHVWSFYMTT